MKATRLALLAALAVLAGGLLAYRHLEAGATGEAGAAGGSGERHAGSGGGRHGQGRAAGPIAVVTAVAATRDVPMTASAVGWAEPIQSVAVHTRIDGAILQQAVTDGQSVQAGDLLFQLDDRAIRAAISKDQATIDKDEAGLDQAKADLARDQSLAGYKNAVSAQQVEAQQAVVKGDAAAVAIDQAALQADEVTLGYTTITAPIGGRIGVVGFTKGALVRASDTAPLLTITEMAPLRVSYTEPERQLTAFRAALDRAEPAKVQVFAAGETKPLASGRLDFIDSSVDTSSGTVMVKARFDNADGALWPGQYVRVETELGLQKGVTVVPLTAVQMSEKGSFVYLARPDGTAAAQPVTVASADGGMAVIASGVSPGDHVVVEGQLHLRDGSPIRESLASGSGGKAAPGAAASGPA